MSTAPFGLDGPTSTALAVSLVTLALKATALLALTGLAVWTLRGLSAAERHLLWTVGLFATLALPLLAVATPPVAVPFWEPTWILRTSSDPTSAGAASGAGQVEFARGDAASSDTRLAAQAEPGFAGPERRYFEAWLAAPDPGWRLPVHPLLLVTVWALGVLAVLLSWAADRVRLAGIERCAGRFGEGTVRQTAARAARRLGLRREPRLLLGGPGDVPMTWGVLNGRVLLPEGADRWEPRRLEDVLVHELAHVRRHDCAAQSLARLACAVHWFNPLVWLAAARMRRERELAADDLVVGSGADPSAYAHDLVALARSLGRRVPPPRAALPIVFPGRLRERLLAVTDPARCRRPLGPSKASMAVGTALLLGAAAAAAAPVERSAPPPSTSAPQGAGTITGTVRDAETGAPLPNVQVYLMGARLGTLSGATGEFTLPDAPAGTWELRAERVGLATGVHRVSVVDGATAAVAFDIAAQAISLTGIRSDRVAAVPAVSPGPRPQPTPAPPVTRPPELADRPIFTPFSVQPAVVNPAEVAEALRLAYPSALRDAGIGGTVTMDVFVDVDGQAVRWSISAATPANPRRGSSGQPALDQAAADALAVVRFSPAYNRDQRVPVWVTLPLIFVP